MFWLGRRRSTPDENGYPGYRLADLYHFKSCPRHLLDVGTGVDRLERRADGVRILLGEPGEQSIGVAKSEVAIVAQDDIVVEQRSAAGADGIGDIDLTYLVAGNVPVYLRKHTHLQSPITGNAQAFH